MVRRSSRTDVPHRDGLAAVALRPPYTGVESHTLWQWARQVLPGDAKQLCELFRDGRIVDAHANPLSPGELTGALGPVFCFRPVPDEPPRPFRIPIIAEGDGWVAVEKPAGLAAMPRGRYVARSVTVALRRQTSNDELVPVHRLDRATRGVMLFSTRPDSRARLQTQFQNRRVQKVYRALVGGDFGWICGEDERELVAGSGVGGVEPCGGVEVRDRLEKPAGSPSVVAVEGDANAVTRFRALERVEVPGIGRCLYVEAFPLTGRMHQIRAQLAFRGAPIVGDPLYGGVLAAPYGQDAPQDGQVWLQLLAHRISLDLDGAAKNAGATGATEITSGQTLDW